MLLNSPQHHSLVSTYPSPAATTLTTAEAANCPGAMEGQPGTVMTSAVNFKRLSVIAILLWAGAAALVVMRPRNETLSRLAEQLASGHWQTANVLTWQILAPNAQVDSLMQTDCDLLLEVDRLWSDYSDGQLGLRTQSRLATIAAPTSLAQEWAAQEAPAPLPPPGSLPNAASTHQGPGLADLTALAIARFEQCKR